MKKPMKKPMKKADGGMVPGATTGYSGSSKMKPFHRGEGKRPGAPDFHTMHTHGARPMPMPSRPRDGARPMPMPSRPGPDSSMPSRPIIPGGGDRTRINPIGGGPIRGGGGRTPIPMAKKKGGMAKGKKK